MKVTIEGQVYNFDRTLVRNKHYIVLERATGMTTGEWEQALEKGSVLAITGLVWLVLQQDGQSIDFGDVDFDPRQVDVDFSDEEPGKDPAESAEDQPPTT